MRAIQSMPVLVASLLAAAGCSPDAPHDPLAPPASSMESPTAAAVAAPPALPFHGRVTATETHFVSEDGVFFGHVAGTGTATHLGRFTLQDEEVGNPATLAGEVSIVLTAANGDIITAAGPAQAYPAPDFSSFTNIETVTITGGTGRFAGASGSFVLERVVDITAGSPYPSTGTLTGSIVLAR